MKTFFLLLSVTIFSINLFAKEKVIAKIPEASGIVYSEKSNTLFVVNDEGTIYELSLKGKIKREKKLGDYDLEGIAIDEKKNILLLANEENDEIILLNKKDFSLIKKIKIKGSYKGNKVLKKGKNGIEGITLYKDKIYASNQSNKPYPKEDSSVVIILDNKSKKKLKIKDIIDHGYKDIAGLCFYKDFLYLVSDDANLLIKYDINSKKTIKEYKLSKKYAQEGITFDKKGNLYIADDKGKILKLKIDE
ncbi:MAG: SdiA-regulated domain-containing protein [Campylobacteraceae bacterium]|nr:SdiA-regulated domain-containing protein [Campylobacteraceae bacterium]